MSPAKCVGVLIVLAVLFYLFIFNRRKMNQLSVSIAITYVVLAGYRLLSQQGDEGVDPLTVAIFLGGGAIVWAVMWGSQRWMARKSGSAGRRTQNHG